MNALSGFDCDERDAFDVASICELRGRIELVVVQLAEPPSLALPLIAEVADVAPELAVVVVRDDAVPEFLAGAIGAGAQDVLTPADLEGGRLQRAALSAVYRKRFSESAARQVRQAEYVSLERWSRPPASTLVSAHHFGGDPLSRAEPQRFGRLVERYAELVLDSLREEAYAGRGDLTARLREVAAELGHANAGPRDVIALHAAAVRGRLDGARDGVAAHAYMQEARYVLVQLMGYLLGFYRAHALGTTLRPGGGS